MTISAEHADALAMRAGVSPLGDVVAAHAVISPPAQLVADRRALYRLAVTLTGVAGDRPMPDDLLDDPVLRFAVGEVLAGRRSPHDLRLPGPGRRPAGPGPAIAGDPTTAGEIRPALDAVAQECGSTPALIVEGDPRFARAEQEVRAGLDDARRRVPDLFGDLVGHVAVIGILDPARSGAVVSASSRSMPGVVLLRAGGPLDVAESFVHEAAHQRLFDMALTRDMLRADADGIDEFPPSWRRTTWPREQALAAFHAYACLARLWRAVPAVPRPVMAPHSVLPEATSRARELGEWLFARLDRLGADACRLVGALLNRPLPLAPEPPPEPRPGRYRAAPFTVVTTDEGRCLVGLADPTPQLLWLDRETTAVFTALRDAAEMSTDEILQRCGSAASAWTVHTALDRLVRSELAAFSGA